MIDYLFSDITVTDLLIGLVLWIIIARMIYCAWVFEARPEYDGFKPEWGGECVKQSIYLNEAPAIYNPTIQGCPQCQSYVEPPLTECDMHHHCGCRIYPTKNVIANPVNCNCNGYKKAATKPYNLEPLPMNEGAINEKETLST